MGLASLPSCPSSAAAPEALPAEPGALGACTVSSFWNKPGREQLRAQCGIRNQSLRHSRAQAVGLEHCLWTQTVTLAPGPGAELMCCHLGLNEGGAQVVQLRMEAGVFLCSGSLSCSWCCFLLWLRRSFYGFSGASSGGFSRKWYTGRRGSTGFAHNTPLLGYIFVFWMKVSASPT